MTTSTSSQVVEVPAPAAAPDSRLRMVDFPAGVVPPVVETMELEVRSYPGATAILKPSQGANNNKNIGAAYTADGELITETERAKPLRNWWPSPRRLPRGVKPTVHLEGRTFYAGAYQGHFGHVLLETLTRFWPDLDYHQFEHLLTIPKFVERAWNGETNDLYNRFMRLAQLPLERVRVVFEPMWCEELLVPTSPFRLAVAADPRFLTVFDQIGDRVERDVYQSDLSHLPKRIYFSRTKVTKNKRIWRERNADNEPAAEELFAQHGFEIVHPQLHPLEEQIALARNADVIAGCDGSALHLAMFSRPGTQLLAIDSRVVLNQFLIDQCRGLDAIHVWAGPEVPQTIVTEWSIDLPRVAGTLDLLFDSQR